MRALRAGALYFATVFAAGFILGGIRTIWVAPRLGARAAELLETPVMLGIAYVAARWVVRRLRPPPTTARRLGIGVVALALLVATELTVVLRIRGLSFTQYLANRDPVASTVYAVALVAFGLMPLFIARD